MPRNIRNWIWDKTVQLEPPGPVSSRVTGPFLFSTADAKKGFIVVLIVCLSCRRFDLFCLMGKQGERRRVYIHISENSRGPGRRGVTDIMIRIDCATSVAHNQTVDCGESLISFPRGEWLWLVNLNKGSLRYCLRQYRNFLFVNHAIIPGRKPNNGNKAISLLELNWPVRCLGHKQVHARSMVRFRGSDVPRDLVRANNRLELRKR